MRTVNRSSPNLELICALSRVQSLVLRKIDFFTLAHKHNPKPTYAEAVWCWQLVPLVMIINSKQKTLLNSTLLTPVHGCSMNYSTHRINQYPVSSVYITLTKRMWGPYCKLRTECFSHRIMTQARSARDINRGRKKRGSMIYSTDREDEVSKILTISLLCVWGVWERFLFTRSGFKLRKRAKSQTSQFEIVGEWLLSH